MVRPILGIKSKPRKLQNSNGLESILVINQIEKGKWKHPCQPRIAIYATVPVCILTPLCAYCTATYNIMDSSTFPYILMYFYQSMLCYVTVHAKVYKLLLSRNQQGVYYIEINTCVPQFKSNMVSQNRAETKNRGLIPNYIICRQPHVHHLQET